LRISGPKRDEVICKWRKLHNEELYGLHYSPIIKVRKSITIRRAGNVARMEERSYRVLVGRPEGKRPLGRHRSRWEDNINMTF
jgi:hypothetical protein